MRRTVNDIINNRRDVEFILEALEGYIQLAREREEIGMTKGEWNPVYWSIARENAQEIYNVLDNHRHTLRIL